MSKRNFMEGKHFEAKFKSQTQPFYPGFSFETAL